jgi:hypothetical protein
MTNKIYVVSKEDTVTFTQPITRYIKPSELAEYQANGWTQTEMIDITYDTDGKPVVTSTPAQE